MVGTDEGTSPRYEGFTRRDWSHAVVPRTVHMKRFEEQVAGTCNERRSPNQFEFVRLVPGDQSWVLVTKF